ncbi:MAG: hypothetical protein LBR98_06595 [Syntrophomonadaceae bacterium]|jgi:hypothetical protein|nr:hypothetical protein [Syntrophomonadaceae bacterium]
MFYVCGERTIKKNQLFRNSFLEAREDPRLISYSSAGFSKYGTRYYEYQEGNFIFVETEYVFTEKQDDVSYKVTQISRLINGEMKIVKEDKAKLEKYLGYQF